MNQNESDEQIFFNDPALDRAFGVVMALATEVYVLKDRQKLWNKCYQGMDCWI